MLSLLHLEGGPCTLMETELHSFWLYGLPEDLSPLSPNGSHLNERCVDLPAAGREHLLHRLEGLAYHTVAPSYQASPAHGLEPLRIEPLGQRHPARFRRRALGPAV